MVVKGDLIRCLYNSNIINGTQELLTVGKDYVVVSVLYDKEFGDDPIYPVLVYVETNTGVVMDFKYSRFKLLREVRTNIIEEILK